MATDAMESMQSTVLVINGEGMGRADKELQLKLMVTYMRLLIENDLLPNAICLYTNGVKLAVEGSPVLDQLKKLENKGVRIILCSTCLKYFGLVDQVKAGIVGGMADIIEAQTRAHKVLTL